MTQSVQLTNYQLQKTLKLALSTNRSNLQSKRKLCFELEKNKHLTLILLLEIEKKSTSALHGAVPMRVCAVQYWRGSFVDRRDARPSPATWPSPSAGALPECRPCAVAQLRWAMTIAARVSVQRKRRRVDETTISARVPGNGRKEPTLRMYMG